MVVVSLYCSGSGEADEEEDEGLCFAGHVPIWKSHVPSKLKKKV